MDKKKLSLKDIGIPKLAILFLAGIVLIVLSFPDFFGRSNKTEENKTQLNTNLTSNSTKDLEETESIITYYEDKLKNTLEHVEGIGKVEVMITLKSSKEQIVLKDSPYEQETLNESDEVGGSRINQSLKKDESTVLITNSDGENVPYVTKELEALVEGVVIIAEGGGDGKIAFDIASAVEVLFNVPAHKVKVLQMSTK